MLVLLALTMLIGASKVSAQAPSNETQSPSPVVVRTAGENQTSAQKPEHRFWDKKNDWLFVSVGAARTFDYFSTLNLRRRGDQEVLLTNDIVDNHAAFAAIGAGGFSSPFRDNFLCRSAFGYGAARRGRSFAARFRRKARDTSIAATKRLVAGYRFRSEHHRTNQD